MNKTFYILFFVFAAVFCNAQTNLIYNGDFEMYDTCPTFTSSPGDDQVRFCLGWKAPTNATSDYFRTCSAPTSVGVPVNTFGYQIPYSGDAYCGSLIEYYSQSTIPDENGWYVEYIQSKLNSPLIAGHEYEFSCWIILSTNDWDYAFWKFGAYFSSIAITKTDTKPFADIMPQIINVPGNFITDTLNWQEIKGKFIAHGAEEYITLGFYTDTLIPDTLKLINNFTTDPSFYGSYYYIDACSLTETGQIFEYPNVFSPNGDNQNDEWKPFISEGETIEIYDRWGIKVYELSKENQTWYGRTTSGQMCVDGVYYYLVQNKSNNSKKGFIQLVR